jgi:hypothetical protein
MKWMYDPSRLTEFFVKAGLLMALALVLLAPMTINANGGDDLSPALKRSSWNALRLPPIPHLESMRWLTLERAPRGFRIDTLLAPGFEIFGPAVATTRDDGLLSSIEGRAPVEAAESASRKG